MFRLTDIFTSPSMKKILINLFLVLAFSPAFSQNLDLFSEYYTTGEFEKAYEQSSQLIKEYPEKPEVVVMHGRVLVDMGQYNEGKEFLNKAISLDKDKSWISAWAWAYLGHAAFMTENYEFSKEALKNCLKLNATQTVNRFANRRMFSFGFDDYFNDWKIIETANLRFHIQMPSEIINIQDFIEQREEAFCNINKTLGAKIPKKIDFFVWNNADEPKKKFNLSLGFASPEFACVYSQKNQTKGHEITHVITHYIGKSKNKTGLINEGTAVYFNQTKENKLENAKNYMAKINIASISVKDLWKDWTMVDQGLSYPLAGAFVSEFVNKFGEDGLIKILPDQTYENSRKIFGEELDTLIGTFEKKLNNGLPQGESLNKSAQARNTPPMGMFELKELFFLNGKEVLYEELKKIDRNDIDTVVLITDKNEIEKITTKDCNMLHMFRTKKKN